VVRRFGETFAEGGHGGTGIALYKARFTPKSTIASSATR